MVAANISRSSTNDATVVIRKQIQSIQFGFYTDADVRSRSVVEVTSPTAFDPLRGTVPVPGGLYDAKLGPMQANDRWPCPTCARTFRDCPGHFGHLELAVPVHHPLLLPEILTLLRCICRSCFHFRAVPRLAKLQAAKLALLETNQFTRLAELDATLAAVMHSARNNNADNTNNSNNNANRAAATRAATAAVDAMLQSILLEKSQEQQSSLTAITINTTTSTTQSSSSHSKTLFATLKKDTLTMLKSAARCARCGAFSPKLRHDAHNKIFSQALSAKMQRLNNAEGVRIQSALRIGVAASSASASGNNAAEGGYDSDDTQTRGNNNKDYNDEAFAAALIDSQAVDDDEGEDMDNDEQDTEEAIQDEETPKKKSDNQRDTYLHTAELEALLQRVWDHEKALCHGLFGAQGVERYILQCIAVPPNRFRPPMNVSGALGLVEHAQTAALSKILVANAAVRERMALNDTANAYPAWIALQTAVNIYMDAAQDPAAGSGGGPVQGGIRQMLERKEGLFRKHMMGKRVDYACRSVISPDPYIGTSEIGLPQHFCRVLTYPTPVTERNVAEMRRLVERGPNEYPGARWVELSTSDNPHNSRRRVDLTKMKAHQRQAIAAQLMLQHARKPGVFPVVVGRQLRDGDYVLMNRQPTLHKPGIMAHRVRVLHNPDQKTIRMHYANCNTYNADFDGDEMNCHFPQNDLARAEAQFIVQADLQYIVPTDGSPLRGLIQDHVVGGVKMTKKDTFFRKWEFQQLVFAALTSLSGLEVIRHDDKIEMIPPAIVKPQQLWTGKQVISTILLHLRKGSDRDSGKLSNFPGLSMERQSKTSDSAFGPAQEEHLVLIRDGELLRGVLDKNAFGATDFSLVHCVYEAYGPEKAGLLLNIFGRLFTAYIQFYSGHSCRMEDLILTKDADSARRKLIERAYNIGARAAKAWADSEGGKVTIPSIKDQPGADEPLKPVESASAAIKIGLLLSGNDGGENFAALDGFMQGQLNPLASDIVKKSLPGGLAVAFPHNTFGIMTTTGAKGSIVNQSQVTCALGQQALEGRRVPRMSSGRTMPSFAPYDPSPRADGFVMDRFLTGIRPQEYYFHCMAGREGLVDTAVKTSRSGYLQRCLVKHLEELKVCYDYTVRNSESNIIQFLYGEDGLDPTKASYLDGSERSFEYIARNHDALQRHNPALLSSTIEVAAKDATYRDHLESSIESTIRVGDDVKARRLRTGHKWVRGALCHGWSSATVTKVYAGGTAVDLTYHADGHKQAKLPVEVELGRSDGAHSKTLSDRATLVKPYALDPILSSVVRGHRIGSSGACVSERVAKATLNAMSDDSKLGKVLKAVKLSKRKFSSLIGAKYSSSVCAPGEAVGSIAAQSVGEPSTQMTLNTFHLAGAGSNVTLGIPRLREIIMTASRALKTPTMSVPLLEHVTDKEAIRLARGFSKLSLMDLIAGNQGISVTERLQKDESGAWQRAYYVNIKFHAMERISEAFGISLHDIALVVAKNFVPLLSQIMKKELKRSSVGDGDVGTVAGGIASDYLDDSVEADPQAAPITNETDELNEEEEEDILDDVPGEEDGVDFGRQRDNESYDEGRGNLSPDDDSEGGQNEPMLSSFPDRADSVEETLNEKCSPTVNKRTNSIALQALKVEPNVRPLLMVGLVEKAASAILVRSKKNIHSAFINDEADRGRCLQTAGINIEEMWKLDSVRHHELSSNDIWAVRCSYGVEAARNSILGQIRSVFGAYGIEVDARHLALISDYMTFDGGFKPMSRIGMDDCSSPLLQMSFETTAQFLNRAALTNAIDSLESPSANIVVGRPIRHGTGAFSLLARS